MVTTDEEDFDGRWERFAGSLAGQQAAEAVSDEAVAAATAELQAEANRRLGEIGYRAMVGACTAPTRTALVPTTHGSVFLWSTPHVELILEAWAAYVEHDCEMAASWVMRTIIGPFAGLASQLDGDE